jgi:hypothetical protein
VTITSAVTSEIAEEETMHYAVVIDRLTARWRNIGRSSTSWRSAAGGSGFAHAGYDGGRLRFIETGSRVIRQN